jgi:alpha-tubulin suppressor-like RCC1 family protein
MQRILALGDDHACILRPNGAVQCWGDDSKNQLGDGLDAATTTPKPVPILGTVSAIAAGGSHTCAISDAGLFCWGSNDHGQSDPSSFGTPVGPTKVAAPDAGVVDVALGTNHTCWATPTAIVCRGANDFRQSLGDAGGGSVTLGAVALAAGTNHTCALRSSTPSELVCWGDNSSGQVTGSASGGGIPLPAMLPAVYQGAVAIAAGVATSCGIYLPGEGLRCVGSFTPPLPGALPMRVAQLSVHTVHACRITPTGQLGCVGDNHYGELGTGSLNAGANSPTDVLGGTAFVAVATGGIPTRPFTCGLTPAGAIYCWGTLPTTTGITDPPALIGP